MTLKVTKVEMWSTTIDDRAGGLADKIDPLTPGNLVADREPPKKLKPGFKEWRPPGKPR